MNMKKNALVALMAAMLVPAFAPMAAADEGLNCHASEAPLGPDVRTMPENLQTTGNDYIAEGVLAVVTDPVDDVWRIPAAAESATVTLSTPPSGVTVEIFRLDTYTSPATCGASPLSPNASNEFNLNAADSDYYLKVSRTAGESAYSIILNK